MGHDPSWEASSTTMISFLGHRWPRALSTERRIVSQVMPIVTEGTKSFQGAALFDVSLNSFSPFSRSTARAPGISRCPWRRARRSPADYQRDRPRSLQESREPSLGSQPELCQKIRGVSLEPPVENP